MAEADFEKLRERISINPMDNPEPPANIMEQGMRLLQEQGKLETFIEVSTPKAEQPVNNFKIFLCPDLRQAAGATDCFFLQNPAFAGHVIRQHTASTFVES